jgi:hypothetical protein
METRYWYGYLPRFHFIDTALAEVDFDQLEPRLLEACISEMQAVIRVQHRFCSECQRALDTWPALESQVGLQPQGVRQYNTISMEAPARNGSHLCACVL